MISTGPHGIHPTAEATAAVDVEVGRTPTVPVDRVYGSFPLMGIDPDGGSWEGYCVDLRDVEVRSGSPLIGRGRWDAWTADDCIGGGRRWDDSLRLLSPMGQR